MANNPMKSNYVHGLRRDKLNVNVRSQREICHREQAHANVGYIDAKSIQMGRVGKDVD